MRERQFKGVEAIELDEGLAVSVPLTDREHDLKCTQQVYLLTGEAPEAPRNTVRTVVIPIRVEDEYPQIVYVFVVKPS